MAVYIRLQNPGDKALFSFRWFSHRLELDLPSVRNSCLPKNLSPVRASDHGPGGERHEGRRCERPSQKRQQSHRYRLRRWKNCK